MQPRLFEFDVGTASAPLGAIAEAPFGISQSPHIGQVTSVRGFEPNTTVDDLPSTTDVPDVPARRLALCQEAFDFVDALRTNYINSTQNKTALTFVFQHLGDVPMPKEEWFVAVFRNYDCDDMGLIGFESFKDIVIQWHEHHLQKSERRQSLEPCYAPTEDGLPPPPPMGDSLGSSQGSPGTPMTSEISASQMPASNTSPYTSEVIVQTPAALDAIEAPIADPTSLVSGHSQTSIASAAPSIIPPPPPGPSSSSVTNACPPLEHAPVCPLKGDMVGDPSSTQLPLSSGQPVRNSPSSLRVEGDSDRRVSAADIKSEVMFPTYVGRLAIFDDYEFFGDVGHGSFGKVMVVRHKQTKQVRACKVMAVQSSLQRELIDTEIRLLKELNHPNIMKLYEVYFETGPEQRVANGSNIYLVTELCEGGDLFSRILHHYERLKQPMTEGHVSFMLQQILSATKYCHDQNIIHRDIKPENILFVNRSSSSPIKIIDFGLANFTKKIQETAKEVKVPRGGTMGRIARMLPAVGGKHLIPLNVRKQVMQRAGTAHYMAPEMIEGYYDQKADIFSIGVILCQLLTGWHPFYVPQVDDEQSVRAKIASPDPVELSGDAWSHVSTEAKDLCSKLLCKDPACRFSADEALSHSWLRDPAKPSPFGNVEGLSVSIFDGLLKYQAYNKLKRAVLQLLTRELSEFQIQEIRKKFMALDKQGDGMLSPEELILGMRHVGYEMSDKELEGIVAALDSSGNQRIGYKEFVSALIERRVKFDRQQLWECFRKFDKHSNGRIAFEDVQNVLRGSAGGGGITESEWRDITQANKSSPNERLEITFEDFVALMDGPDES